MAQRDERRHAWRGSFKSVKKPSTDAAKDIEKLRDSKEFLRESKPRAEMRRLGCLCEIRVVLDDGADGHSACDRSPIAASGNHVEASAIGVFGGHRRPGRVGQRLQAASVISSRTLIPSPSPNRL